MCWTYFKTTGHRPVTRGKGAKPSLQTFLPTLEKSVGYSWKLLKILWKIGPLSENSSPHLVPLLACVKPSDGLAFLTNNRDVTLILRWLSTSCSKGNADWNLSLNCARRYFVKSKFGYWHPLICSYESTYILLVDWTYSIGKFSDIFEDNVTRRFAFRYSRQVFIEN